MTQQLSSQQIADMLLRASGGVGDPSVRAYYPGQPAVGDPSVRAYYPGMGAPVAMVDQPAAGAPPVQYTQQTYIAGDVSWFGFGHTNVPSGSVGTPINLTPKRPFAPQKLFCPSNVQNLELLAADIAGTNIFAAGLGVPIEMFSEVSTAPQLSWPTIDTNTGIDFTVANTITASDKFFRGAFYCTALRR
jgi:hypothetical protein